MLEVTIITACTHAKQGVLVSGLLSLELAVVQSTQAWCSLLKDRS